MHDVNNTMSMANPPAVVWQPVTPTNTLKDIMGKKLPAIRAFSIISIVLGILSIFIQIAALVICLEYIYSSVYYPLDVIGHGIWCGAFYVTAGSLGTSACRTPTRSLLVKTVVMSTISIVGAIVASGLSGIMAIWGTNNYCHAFYGATLCNTWEGLEWALMSISILAFINSITLVALASGPLCCGGSNKGPQGNMGVTIGVGGHQQPMYYQPQPMYVGAQQQPIYLAPQQQPNAQFVHAGQQNPQQMQYPQQQQFPSLPNSQVVNVPQQQGGHYSQPLQQQQQQPQRPQQVPSLLNSQAANVPQQKGGHYSQPLQQQQQQPQQPQQMQYPQQQQVPFAPNSQVANVPQQQGGRYSQPPQQQQQQPQRPQQVQYPQQQQAPFPPNSQVANVPQQQGGRYSQPPQQQQPPQQASVANQKQPQQNQSSQYKLKAQLRTNKKN
ncbi:adenylate cyclase, terminal-differentiation specific-like isoform X2 [Daphnia carinata]|uniref:adenylate cyclase, terminal-differentiation specific-like isoform X2 n=1 Tax=Daphnia carinata TaxID=120202 RepID=UPI002868B592|nr:adenylate cyclase, terminal-differentiation specific-like isoform X2 [Daphnia carinata]